MTTPIDVDTLRDWLTQGRPVTVLDIRPDAARAEWSIPGSVHLSAYDELRQGKPGALARAELPHDRPIVTVCDLGRTSQKAADLLSQRGLDARSLAGGMKAWSLAWNTAVVPVSGDAVEVIQVRRTGKGCLSYLVISDGEAAVIDASLPAGVYVQLIAGKARIRYVVETHVHADHLSRAPQLATITGAELLIPDQDRVAFPFAKVADGRQITVGRSMLTALRLPGHTPESTSYLLDRAAVFTGDTLFTNGVGRPDLHGNAEDARQQARVLFDSLKALRALGPDVLVLPAHASEPVAFDGRPVASTIAGIDHWLGEWLSSESGFVERLVSRLPETPPNFTRIVELNERGELPEGDATDLEAGANRCAVS
jgi:glyoxylase-like metal-dependent hydrolase (beta-lactamase superfamily II)/rhodanese-related sulfurtransferase